MDTKIDSLMEKYTIKEIKEIENKTRAEIEKKKEELRQMVGERYRDLIEAADTISAMKKSIEDVAFHITAMEDHCQKLQLHTLHDNSTHNQLNRKQTFEKYYMVAAQIKLLLDIPEKIWNFIEYQNYLQATQLYLLARHVHTSLQLEPTGGIPVSSWFPLLSRQWAGISHFKSVLLTNCEAMLQESDLAAQTLAEVLCCMLLLGDRSTNEVVANFFSSRTAVIKKLYNPQKHDMGIKGQICSTVHCIISTLYLVYSVFHPASNSSKDKESLLFQTLKSVAGEDAPGPLPLISQHSSPAMKYLPKSIAGFRLRVHSNVQAITPEHLQKSCSEWLNQVSSITNKGILQLLSYIVNIRGLAIIRDAVWELIDKNIYMQKWDDICNHLLDKHLLVWEEFLQPLFTAQVKQIIQSHLDETFIGIMQQVNDSMKNACSEKGVLEQDISSFIWTETPGDLPLNVGWIPASNRGTTAGGNLFMKTRGFTPRIQMLCNNLNSKLKTLIEDLAHYHRAECSKNTTLTHLANQEDIRNFIVSTTDTWIHRMLESFHRLIGSPPSIDLEFNDPLVKNYVISVIFLGRLCNGMNELCPAMQQCLKGSWEPAVEPNPKKITNKLISQTSEETKWKQIKSQTQSESHNMFRLWKEILCLHLKKNLSEAVKKLLSPHALQIIPHWDAIEIQEESEDGRTIISKIFVPMQVSWHVQKILFDLCLNINGVGSHALSRVIIQDLHQCILDTVLTSYEIINANMNISQTCALQLLFDLQFICSIMGIKESKVFIARYQSMIEIIESYIDPFDLDVFTPHIQNHLCRNLQRSVILLGALNNPDKTGLSINRSVNTSQSENHNVLSLVTGAPRFTLLPAGGVSEFGKNSYLETSTKVSQKKSKQVTTKPQETTGLSNITANSKSTASALFGAMNLDSWFRN